MKETDAFGLIKLVATLLTPAAAFYAVGYVVTQAYVTTTGLQASFWFTEVFYREAGARFLLDIVTAIALLPHLFILLAVFFMVMAPDDLRALLRYTSAAMKLRFSDPRGIVLREAVFVIGILVVAGFLYYVLRDCAKYSCATLIGAPEWLFTTSWLFGGTQSKWLVQQPLLYPMAIFLVVAVPTVAALGFWAYRATSSKARAGSANPGTPQPVLGFLVVSALIVFSSYIPLAYGTYFYDFVVVSLVEKNKCAPESEPATGTPARKQARPTLDQCYLLGRFETRYILIGRNVITSQTLAGTVEPTDQRIYIIQVEKLEPFAIEGTTGSPLRGLTGLEPDDRRQL